MEKLKLFDEIGCLTTEPYLRIEKAVNKLITDAEAKDERIARLEEAVKYLATVWPELNQILTK